ncbi:DNA polymerase [Burkholderia phage BcepGomr]|uniref:DNA polymerase n=1 Tax=Burkholderia phage BcepGomr TaxID=437329 RepID=UPI00015034C7|nr:DNA polymerase [Burkholderia phage BcepGomr]ABP63597.1 BcepGomrgp26 [Burkholderia phage BcepGomr]
MRFDSDGLFWQELPVVKVSKAAEKRLAIPPDPVWLKPDYLPNLEEAIAFRPTMFASMEEIIEAQAAGERLVYDIESYPNFWCIGFRSIQSGKHLYFECDDANHVEAFALMKWVFENFTVVSFNGIGYDQWIAAIACMQYRSPAMYGATVKIIEQKARGYDVIKEYRSPRLEMDHIDLIELTPLHPSLKKLAARFGSPMMMDLPVPPGTICTPEQKAIIRWYMFNDLRNTQLVYEKHFENIKLRERFGAQYGIDLRSKSDAQMAEAIFRAKVQEFTGRYPQKQKVRPGHRFKFRMPKWVQFKTETLQWVKRQVENAEFEIDENGYVKMPPELAEMVIDIRGKKYKMGIGGLHSQEVSTYHVAMDGWKLRDHDVASYYPKLILMTGMVPPGIGEVFTPIYIGIVDERIEAKGNASKEKKANGESPLYIEFQVTADGLKIVVNGSFGKTMDKHSVLYFPELGIQTTVSGQLALLMAIEAVELANMSVVNANTDGIVIKFHESQEDHLKAVMKEWENATTLEMETTDYIGLFSRDVNSYIAVKQDADTGKISAKRKGAFGESSIKTDPSNEICSDAVSDFLCKGTPLEQTIRACTDIKKFVDVKNATGGCCKVWDESRTEYIGRVARWYRSTTVEGIIVKNKNGHAVPGTENGRPVMRLPETFPEDIDYEYYISTATEMLAGTGYPVH